MNSTKKSTKKSDQEILESRTKISKTKEIAEFMKDMGLA